MKATENEKELISILSLMVSNFKEYQKVNAPKNQAILKAEKAIKKFKELNNI